MRETEKDGESERKSLCVYKGRNKGADIKKVPFMQKSSFQQLNIQTILKTGRDFFLLYIIVIPQTCSKIYF